MEKHPTSKTDRVMSRDEVRAVDRWAIEELGIPGTVLMENAGRSCADLIRTRCADMGRPSVCVFCGTGNNGGDGYVIARHLLNVGFAVTVVICGDRRKVRGDAKINLDILERMGQAVAQLDLSGEDMSGSIEDLAGRADIVVDALLGTGLKGQLSPEYCRMIDTINALGRPILAVDIPSGLDCDTGQRLGTSIRATWTVTFVAVKRGFLASREAREAVGELYVASIGIEPVSGA